MVKGAVWFSYYIGLLTIYDTEKQKVQLQLFMASNESVKGLLM